MKTDAIYYPAPAVRFRDFVRGQGLHLLLACVWNPVWNLGFGGFSAAYQHPTIVGKKSQRITRDLASFGIKNAREFVRRACQDHFFLRSGINKLVPCGLPASLLDLNISLRLNTFQLACTLIFSLSLLWQQDDLDAGLGDGGVLGPNHHI